MGKYTKTDIKRIASAIRRQKDDKPDRPYSLLTGAGCSKTAGIPLAGELVKEIKEKYKLEIEHRLGAECDDNYGACMSVLSSNEVKDNIQPYLNGAGVNWGHIAIASLMKAGYIGRVLTFNFDSVLARACGLLGQYPATYDFVSSVSTRTDHIGKQAILHLHGQGHSLAILNDEQETKDHAENLRPLLTEIFSRSPLIVAGYSGESDAVFDVIADIYNGAERLCWSGFDEDCGSHISELLKKRPNASEYLGGADSDIFFMDLAKELECWPPKLFKNPYAHLLEELDPIVDYPETDMDILSNLKSRLRDDQTDDEETPDLALDFFFKGQWEKTIEQLHKDNATESRKDLLASAKVKWATTLIDFAAPIKADLEKACQLFEDAEKAQPHRHQGLNNWGIALSELAKLEKNTDFFEDSIEKYKAALDINPDYYLALSNWGIALANIAEINNDPSSFKESIEKFKAVVDIKRDDHEALYNWGTNLLWLYPHEPSPKFLEEAETVLLRAKTINPDKLYSLACLYAIQERCDKAKEALLHCEAKGTLAHWPDLEANHELNSLRGETWFQDLLTRMRKKDAS